VVKSGLVSRATFTGWKIARDLKVAKNFRLKPVL
jgi:hypothetical protein